MRGIDFANMPMKDSEYWLNTIKTEILGVVR